MRVSRYIESDVPTYVMGEEWTVIKLNGMALLTLDSGIKVTLRSKLEIKCWCEAPAKKISNKLVPTATELIADLLLNIVETYDGDKLTKGKIQRMLVTDKRQLGLIIGKMLKEDNLLPNSHKFVG